MDEQFGEEILNLTLSKGHPCSRHEAGPGESVGDLNIEDDREFDGEHFVQGRTNSRSRTTAGGGMKINLRRNIRR